MNSEPKIIVIAEDDRDDSLFLMDALLSLPLELTVINVPNGERLIKILEVVLPHFIFLDINMPKKNGFVVLEHIRSNKQFDATTVIMCSGSSAVNEINKSEELGADVYFTKPGDLKNFNKMIEGIFKTDWRDKERKKRRSEFLLDSTKNSLESFELLSYKESSSLTTTFTSEVSK